MRLLSKALQLEKAAVESILALPLFPQYSDSTTGSAVAHLLPLAGAREAQNALGAQGGHVLKRRSGDVTRCLGQDGKFLLHKRRFDDIGQSGERTDPQLFFVFLSCLLGAEG